MLDEVERAVAQLQRVLGKVRSVDGVVARCAHGDLVRDISCAGRGYIWGDDLYPNAREPEDLTRLGRTAYVAPEVFAAFVTPAEASEWLTTIEAARTLGIDRSHLDRIAEAVAVMMPTAVVRVGDGAERATYRWHRDRLGEAMAAGRAQQPNAEEAPARQTGRGPKRGAKKRGAKAPGAASLRSLIK